MYSVRCVYDLGTRVFVLECREYFFCWCEYPCIRWTARRHRNSVFEYSNMGEMVPLMMRVPLLDPGWCCSEQDEESFPMNKRRCSCRTSHFRAISFYSNKHTPASPLSLTPTITHSLTHFAFDRIRCAAVLSRLPRRRFSMFLDGAQILNPLVSHIHI